MGFLDDVLNIKQIYRLFFQSLNVFFISFLLFNFDIFANLNLSNGFISIIVFFIGLTLINFVNFMDGMDGLVSSNMFLLFLNYSLNNNFDLISIPIVLFVFLFYNGSPAKFFMGDSGSTFLGIILFYIVFSSKDLNSSIVFILTASPLLMDSLFCILRRELLLLVLLEDCFGGVVFLFYCYDFFLILFSWECIGLFSFLLVALYSFSFSK